MHRLVPLALLLACATLAQAEVITRTHADGSTSVIVPAPNVGPPAPLARGVAWPWFPYHIDRWRLRQAAQQAAQQEQSAQVEALKTPPPSSLSLVIKADGSSRLMVEQRLPSMAPDLDEATRKRMRMRERADKAYAESLARVKQDPSCADCRQEALELGRLARGMARPDGLPTVYDETAIANDLNTVGGAGGR
jgi:hypothetical protein